eukprot:COSAG06_NODE_12363_length_1390_cov_44.954299_1_plen_252_part_10
MADHEWMEHGSCSDMAAGQWLGAGLEALEALGRDAPLGEPLLRAAASRSPPVVGLGSLAAAFASSSAWLVGVPAEQQSVFACARTSNGAGGQRRLTAVSTCWERSAAAQSDGSSTGGVGRRVRCPMQLLLSQDNSCSTHAQEQEQEGSVTVRSVTDALADPTCTRPSSSSAPGASTLDSGTEGGDGSNRTVAAPGQGQQAGAENAAVEVEQQQQLSPTQQSQNSTVAAAAAAEAAAQETGSAPAPAPAPAPA